MTVKGRMYVLMIALIAAGLLSGGLASPVAAFDVFDPAKWDSAEITVVKEINGGKALLGIARKGGFNAGASTFTERSPLFFRNATTIRTIETTVTLLDAGSMGTGFTSSPRVSIDGFFYWDGTGTGTTTDQTGHVQGSLGLRRSFVTGMTEAAGFVTKCTNAACTTSTTLTSVGLGPINFFEPHRLKLDFNPRPTTDPSKGTFPFQFDTFTFQLDNNAPVTFVTPDAIRNTPTVPFMQLRARVVVPADPTAMAWAFGLFDDVAVNGAPYDDFGDITLPKVIIKPASGTFLNTQAFDAALAVVTNGEAVTNIKVTFNGDDISDVLAAATPGTFSREFGGVGSGGVTFRVPGVVPGNIFPPDTPVVFGVEATTASGATARGFAIWSVMKVMETKK